MPRVLMAGLPTALKPWLEQRLDNVSIQLTCSGIEVLQALAGSDYALLLIAHSLTDPAAVDVVRQVRITRGLTALPVVYCVENGPGRLLPRRLLERLGIRQWGYDHLDREALACQVATTLHLPLAERQERRTPRQSTAVVVGLWERFKEEIIGRVSVLEQATLAVLEGYLSETLRGQAVQEAQQLVGAASSFGFAEGARLVQEMTRLLRAGAPLEQAQALHLSELIAALYRELERTPAGGFEAAVVSESLLPLLLVVDSHTALAEHLVAEAAGRGVRVESATDLHTARKAVARLRPDVVVLDLGLSGAPGDSLRLLAELRTGHPQVPVLALTGGENDADRQEVARLGGHSCLQKPLAPAQLLQTVVSLVQQCRSSAIRVMVLEDDPQVLTALQALLEPRGLRLIAYDNPQQFWDAFVDGAPDLLVLDVDRPALQGLELCHRVRQHPWGHALPVLCLTAHTAPTTVHSIYAAGADDTIGKPIVGAELVTRLAHHLERIPRPGRLVETDVLTGLASRQKGLQLLGQFLRLAEQHQQRLSLAFLAIDHAAQVRDHHGRAARDEVLRRLGESLQRSFRDEDSVARWDGEQFVLGMYSMPCAVGVRRLGDILETLRQEEFLDPTGTRFQVTFSAGVAEYPTDGEDLQTLCRVAHHALSQAREAGGNRILPARGSSL